MESLKTYLNFWANFFGIYGPLQILVIVVENCDLFTIQIRFLRSDCY